MRYHDERRYINIDLHDCTPRHTSPGVLVAGLIVAASMFGMCWIIPLIAEALR